MTVNALISIACPDRVGLVAAVTGHLFEIGGNLGDTTFAVLGGAAEFTSVVELLDGTSLQAVEAGLSSLAELEDATVTVSPFSLAPLHGPMGRVTHSITVGGGDRPGLVARLSEAFVEFGANIVRLNAERAPAAGGMQYAVIIAVNIPAGKAASCLATVANTAGSLGLSCHWESIEPPPA